MKNSNLIKSNWVKSAILLFLFYIAIIIYFHLYADFNRTVVGVYYDSAQCWLNGQGLYIINSKIGFNYFLQSAILFIPMALFPYKVSIFLWLILHLGLLCLGIYLVVNKFKLSRDNSKYEPLVLAPFFWIFLWTLALGFGALRSGQMNATILIFTLFVVYCLRNKKGGWACFWLNLGLALKPTMIILYLLVLGCQPRLWKKALLWLLVMLAIPFLLQSTSYVLQQYHDCWLNFTNTINIGVETKNWGSLFDSLRVLHLGLSHNVINIVILLMAVATYFYVLYLSKKMDFKDWVWSLAFMSVFYLLLFNPRTESNGYILIAPFLGYAFVEAYSAKSVLRASLVTTMSLFIALNFDISRNIIAGTTSWVAPLVALLFAIYWIYFIDFKHQNEKYAEVELDFSRGVENI